MDERLLKFKVGLVEKTFIEKRVRAELIESIPQNRSLSYYEGRQEVLLEIALAMNPRPLCDFILLGAIIAQIVVLEDIIDQIKNNN